MLLPTSVPRVALVTDALHAQPQDVDDKLPRDSDLDQSDGAIAAVADDRFANLDQLLLHVDQRSVCDWLWCCQDAQEVAEIVIERVELETD